MTWRHAAREYTDRCCAKRISGTREYPVICGCTTPTPDPDSDCGHKRYRTDLPCGATASHDWHDRRTWEQDPELWHAHVPTRCLSCGHAIEEVR